MNNNLRAFELMGDMGQAVLKTTCPICQKENPELLVFRDDFDKWQKGELIQKCFSYLSARQREMLLTGYCAKCWDETFKEMD